MPDSKASRSPISNADAAQALLRLANALELRRENRFKVRSYRNAARTVQALPLRLSALVERGDDLTALPGIGASIARLLHEYITTGTLTYLEELKSELPPEMADALGLPVDPNLVRRAYKKLGIASLDELKQRLAAADADQQLGTRLAGNLRRALNPRVWARRYQAEPLVAGLRQALLDLPGVHDVVIGGPYRRKAPILSEIVLGVVADDFERVLSAVDERGFVSGRATETGRCESEIDDPQAAHFTLNNGMLLILAPLPRERRGIALLRLTGSAEHWRKLERLPAFPKAARAGGAASDEAQAYRSLGLDYIEPELREGGLEVKAAAAGTLPRLIALSDIRGDLHIHTTESDGGNTLAEMTAAAMERGYAYIAITDHSKRLKMTNGLDEQRLLRQMDAIDAFNATLKGFRVLKSSEVDILADGSLDFSDEVLARLDLVTASVHSSFNLPRQQQTERILRAMDNRYFTILGHATGRLLLSREPYAVDMERIFEKARARGCFVELNANPHRLDIGAEHCRAARKMGVAITISTDAHSIRELDHMQTGIDEARRGWIEAADVLNALPLPALLKRIQAPRR